MSSEPPVSRPAISRSDSAAQKSSSSATPTNKPPISATSSTYIDSGAYVRGTHQITFLNDVLVHPRACILSFHAPVIVGKGSIVYPKATIGGPFLSTPGAEPPVPKPAIHLTYKNPADFEGKIEPTKVGDYVQIHAHAHILHSTAIGDFTVIESHATLLPGASVGHHSKVCSGVTLSSSVPDWTVVYGNGDVRRLRRPLATKNPPPPTTAATSSDDQARSANDESPMNAEIQKSLAKLEGMNIPDEWKSQAAIPENQRMISLNKEREAAMGLLRANAKMQGLARQKAASRESVVGSGSSGGGEREREREREKGR